MFIIFTFIALVSFSPPAFAGGGMFCCDIITPAIQIGRGIYYFFAEDTRDNNKDKTFKLDIGTNFRYHDVTALLYLNDSNLIGINHDKYTFQTNDGDLQYRVSYLAYRRYFLRKIFADIGLGGAVTQYDENLWNEKGYSYHSATFKRTAAKLSIGIEAQANFIGLSIYGTSHFFGNGVRDSGHELFITSETNVDTSESYRRARSRTNAYELCTAITFAI